MRELAVLLVVAVAACSGDKNGPDPNGAGTPDAATAPLRVQWQLVASDGPPRRSAPYVAEYNGKIVLFGGQRGNTTFLNDTWIWDAGTWTQLAPAEPPFARANGRLVGQRGLLILTGGVGRPPGGTIGVLGETWAFDGATWSRLVDSDIPPRQSFGGARLGESVMIFGGATTGGYFNDGRLLAPGGGAWVDTPVGPAGRRAPTLTTIGELVYLYGGAEPSLAVEIHAFDGVAWTVAGTMRSGGRAYHGAAVLAGRLVVFGGYKTSTNPLGETDAWPGGAEVVGGEPPGSGELVTIGDSIYMWYSPPFEPNEPALTGELWRLSVAE